MSFRSKLGPIALICLYALGLGLIAGCGKKGDPLPPLRIVPGPVRDLRVMQQGSVLLLSLSYPATTTSGTALGGVDSIDLLQLVRPPIEGAAPRVEPSEFELGAEPLLSLRGADLAAATTGGRLEVQVPLTQPLPEPEQALVFGVQSVKDGRISPLSNRAAIVPVRPPTPPSGLILEPSQDGIRVGWSYAGDEPPENFRIYRRDARVRGYGDPVGSVAGDRGEWLDRNAAFGTRYIYTVRTLLRKAPPILSAEAGEREIDYRDRFAPPLPARFVALPERGAIRLRWEKSRADDVAGYIVFRRDPGRELRRLESQLITGIEYIDRGLASGVTFEYRIQAVDRLGNASAQSPPVRATPR